MPVNEVSERGLGLVKRSDDALRAVMASRPIVGSLRRGSVAAPRPEAARGLPREHRLRILEQPLHLAAPSLPSRSRSGLATASKVMGVAQLAWSTPCIVKARLPVARCTTMAGDAIEQAAAPGRTQPGGCEGQPGTRGARGSPLESRVARPRTAGLVHVLDRRRFHQAAAD